MLVHCKQIKLSNIMSKDVFKWSDDQIDALIDMVKENEPIYNTKHYNHRNRQAIEQIWAKIDMQLKKPPGVSREQWQKLRICYRRNYNFDGTSKSRWRFFDKLNFLTEFLRFIDPENSLTKCIKRAEEKYIANGNDPKPNPTSSEDDYEKAAEEQLKSEDNISIYYLTDDEITMGNNENNDNDDDDGSDEPNEYLVEYIHDENDTDATDSNAKVDSNKISIKSIKKSIQKRNFRGINNDRNHDDAIENVSSSKTDEHVIEIDDEPVSKKFKEINSPIKENPSTAVLAAPQTPDLQTDSSASVTKAVSPVKSQIEAPQPQAAALTCLCQNDPDTIFLRSILDDFKSMSKKNKCMFKIQVQKAIQDILYPDDD